MSQPNEKSIKNNNEHTHPKMNGSLEDDNFGSKLDSDFENLSLDISKIAGNLFKTTLNQFKSPNLNFMLKIFHGSVLT